ncbi:MAG TPA: hypothetical protein PLX89_20145 [Verrucomicrobiota bacterium]|nr:hypothetical protein [Verrucomicrobiota bacterium]
MNLKLGDPPPRQEIELVLRRAREIPADAAWVQIDHGGRGQVRIDGSVIGTFDPAVSYQPSLIFHRTPGRK